MLTIKLPDGSEKSYPDGVRPREVAEGIGRRLAEAAIAAVADGTIVDLDRPLEPAANGPVAFRVLTPKDREALDVLRHSTAHVMARAILRVFPGAKLAFGPTTTSGFYYDVDLPNRPLSEDDFQAIEAEMAHVVKDAEPFERFTLPVPEARQFVKDLGQDYKVEHIDDELHKFGTLSFYRQGEFVDLCRGPHIPHAGKVGAFKLLSIAGAYWKGQTDRKMLQRVYGTAFFDKKELEAHLAQVEESKKRDHRRLGKELNLFTISPLVGSGLILWMPKGAIVRGILESFIKEELIKWGYQPVYTPHIGKIEMYEKSGHYPYYRDSQYPPVYAHPLYPAIVEHLEILHVFALSALPAKIKFLESRYALSLELKGEMGRLGLVKYKLELENRELRAAISKITSEEYEERPVTSEAGAAKETEGETVTALIAEWTEAETALKEVEATIQSEAAEAARAFEAEAAKHADFPLRLYQATRKTEDHEGWRARVELLEKWVKQQDRYLLKPMNCPHHIQIYAAQPRSYRDLPVRLAEFGTVYRFEQTGELSGLTRVRGFTQDDAHLFCTEDQVRGEFQATMKLTQYFLGTLGLTNYRLRLSKSDPNDPKFAGAQGETWKRAEEDIRFVLDDMKLPYEEAPGEAAFYGPKADFIVSDCLGRQWQLGTVQLDYVLPERFDLKYTGADNKDHRPVMIHRAPLGSMERFMGILIEHFAGAFPLWLAPEQVRVLPISDKVADYATSVLAALQAAGLRASMDARPEKIGAKIRDAQLEKIPVMLVVGVKEAEAKTVSYRDRLDGDRGALPLAEVLAKLKAESDSRAIHQPPAPAEPPPAADETEKHAY